MLRCLWQQNQFQVFLSPTTYLCSLPQCTAGAKTQEYLFVVPAYLFGITSWLFFLADRWMWRAPVLIISKAGSVPSSIPEVAQVSGCSVASRKGKHSKGRKSGRLSDQSQEATDQFLSSIHSHRILHTHLIMNLTSSLPVIFLPFALQCKLFYSGREYRGLPLQICLFCCIRIQEDVW